MRRILLLFSALIILLAAGISSGLLGVAWPEIKLPELEAPKIEREEKVKIVSEESVVTEIVEKMGPSVVTVGVERQRAIFEFDPFDPFGFFERPRQRGTQKEEADIGSGFIVSEDGLVVTNRHVVAQTGVKYKVITADGETSDVVNVYRDPANDIAILKIEASGLKPVQMGDSSKIKVGQLVVAMGTPLGEFRGSVTKGIISGLGRGITAGSPFEGYAEELDDVIQTDAAINPGNSGGPLVNSAGQVIGVNTAVASGAENIGFALPINLVREAIDNFKTTGSFQRAFLGVSYRMVTRELSLLNEIPEGAYVVEVLSDSAAEKARIEKGDIITHFDGERVRGEEGGLAKLINKKKVGDKVAVKVWRDGKELDLQVTLGEYTSK